MRSFQALVYGASLNRVQRRCAFVPNEPRVQSAIAAVDILSIRAANHYLANLLLLDIASHNPGKAYSRFIRWRNPFSRCLGVSQHVLYKRVFF